MLFPNKISHSILLLIISALCSMSVVFIYRNNGAEILSSFIFFVVAFIFPFILNFCKGRKNDISFSTNFKNPFCKTKLAHLLLFIWLILSILGKTLLEDNIKPEFSFTLFIGITLGSIMEELVFRYTILNGLLERYSTTKSVIITSILFAIMHYNVANSILICLYNVSNAFILSTLFGFIFARCKNIFYSIFLHLFVNYLLYTSSFL